MHNIQNPGIQNESNGGGEIDSWDHDLVVRLVYVPRDDRLRGHHLAGPVETQDSTKKALPLPIELIRGAAAAQCLTEAIGHPTLPRLDTITCRLLLCSIFTRSKSSCYSLCELLCTVCTRRSIYSINIYRYIFIYQHFIK